MRGGCRSGSRATPRPSRSTRSSAGGSSSAAALPERLDATITADCGGSNSSRTRLWKVELQRLADQTGLEIVVCHFPPGTSKWNKIEHRLFSFISTNWRGKPLISHEVIINLIAGTSTTTGLKVYAQLDDRDYPKGVEVTDEQLAAVNITRATFHGDWNSARSMKARSMGSPVSVSTVGTNVSQSASRVVRQRHADRRADRGDARRRAHS